MRFNVEDSITKQFIIKTATVVYNCDNTLAIEEIGEKLNIIYKVRSCIDHGSYKELEKIFLKYSEDEHLDLFLDPLICDLFTYIHYIIKTYIEDKNYIEFIKKS